MKIISLVENTTKSELKAKHGLSLYIETKKHKILFDLGPDKTLFENAVKRNIDISKGRYGYYISRSYRPRRSIKKFFGS